MEKIKVVFVHHKLVCGGAEQALFDLICLLDKEKFDVTVFAQHEGPWDEKFREAGINVFYDYFCRKPTLNPIVKLGNIRKKLQMDRSYREGGAGLLDICCPGADIVVSYSVWENEEMIFAQNAKTVKYIHGDPGTNPVYRDDLLNRLDFHARLDRIVCVSESAAKAFVELGGMGDRVEMHYNPLNSENVKRLAQKEVDLPKDAPLICGVGRLSSEKGFERLVYIHKRLLDQGIFHRLVLVGDGPNREAVERMIEMTGTQDTVILAGYQSNPYPYMKQADFLVNSSYTEGLPVIAMECLCLGTPIVAPIPSVGEAFGEEVCGLITENDTMSLEAGIQKMLTDKDFYAQAKAGAQRRSAYFDGGRMVREIEDMFFKLMEK